MALVMRPRNVFFMAARQKRILIVSDGKRGHVHQTAGVVSKLPDATARTLDISMTKSYYFFLVMLAVAAKWMKISNAIILYWLQKASKTPLTTILKYSPDIIISAGSLTHPITMLLGRLWKCPTVICMRPSLLSPRNFGMVVVPRHDSRRCRGENVIYTMGATSNISEGFIFAEAVALYPRLKGAVQRPVGFLIGGNSALNYITPDMAAELSREILLACEENGLSLAATTSRRTPLDAEQVFERELGRHDRCAFLLLASKSEENPVPAIVGLCEVVVVTEDSVSMVSEIISGGKFAVVVEIGKRKKNNKFVALYKDLAAENYIIYTSIDKLNRGIVTALAKRRMGIKPLDESQKVASEIERRFFSGNAVKKQ